jgi:hypothetical protein
MCRLPARVYGGVFYLSNQSQFAMRIFFIYSISLFYHGTPDPSDFIFSASKKFIDSPVPSPRPDMRDVQLVLRKHRYLHVRVRWRCIEGPKIQVLLVRGGVPQNWVQRHPEPGQSSTGACAALVHCVRPTTDALNVDLDAHASFWRDCPV